MACLLALTLVACDPPDDGDDDADTAGSADEPRIEARLDGEPAVGPAEVVVTVHEGEDAVTDAEVEVTGDMTHAGMMPVVATAPHDADGTYRTDGFEFTMAGDWILTVEATRPSGEDTTATLEVSVPGE